jgi:hypothetical protein
MLEHKNLIIWWNELEKDWKKSFYLQVQIMVVLSNMKIAVNNVTNNSLDEEIELEDEFENNSEELQALLLERLLASNKISVGYKKKSNFKNLNPLYKFTNITELRIYNCDIQDLSALDILKSIKIINFQNVTINCNLPSAVFEQNNIIINFESCKINEMKLQSKLEI